MVGLVSEMGGESSVVSLVKSHLPENNTHDEQIPMPDYSVCELGNGVFEVAYEEIEGQRSLAEEIQAAETVHQIRLFLLNSTQVEEEGGMTAGEVKTPTSAPASASGKSTNPDDDSDGECDDDSVEPEDEESLTSGKTPYERSFINRHISIFF